jgi:predicted nucleic acid-binding protein
VKRYVIDTNALISFVTDRNPGQQKRVAELFEAAAALKCSLVCPQHVLTEFVFVMDRVYGVAKAEISAMIEDFIALPGIDVRHDIDFPMLLALWPAVIPDFGDAIVAATCKAIKGSAVATFDARFIKALRAAGIAVQGRD